MNTNYLKHSFSLIFFLATFVQTVSATETIRFWQFWPEAWIAPAIKKFESLHPEIKVKLERLTWSDGYNKIITSMAANQAPDVIEIGSTWIAGLSADGGLKKLNPEKYLDELIQWKSAKVDGDYYAYPWTTSTGALFYNDTLLKTSGFQKPPKNWSQLLTSSQKIHSISDEIYGYGLKTGSYTTWQKFLPYAWSNGGKLFHSKSKAGVADKEFVEAVTFYHKLREFSLYDENIVVRKKFKEGKVGFMIDEPGQVLLLKKESPNLKFGVIPLPHSDTTGKSINFSGGQMLAVTKNTKNIKISEKLIQFLVQKEVVELITRKITTLFPARRGNLKDPFYFKKHPELLVFLKVLETATAPEPHIRWIDLQEIFSEQLEKVLYGRLSPESAMQKAKVEMEEIMAEELF